MAKIKKSYKIYIDEDFCKGCNICVKLCNTNVFDISESINSKGYYIPLAVRLEDCGGCRICELSCPDMSVILIENDSVD